LDRHKTLLCVIIALSIVECPQTVNIQEAVFRYFTGVGGLKAGRESRRKAGENLSPDKVPRVLPREKKINSSVEIINSTLELISIMRQEVNHAQNHRTIRDRRRIAGA
jgi:hypothetical protein